MVGLHLLLKIIETCPRDNLDAGKDANDHRAGADDNILRDQVDRLYLWFDVTDEDLPGFPRWGIVADHG